MRNNESSDGVGTVVVGVDGSPTSFRAAAYAIGLARRQAAPVVAVYVRKHAGVFAIVDDLAVGIERLVDAQDEIEDQLRAYLTAQGSAAGVTTTFLVRYGDPARTLRQLAGDLHADAVVVGSYTSALHKVSGSTLAGRLLRARQWPVIVVP